MAEEEGEEEGEEEEGEEEEEKEEGEGWKTNASTAPYQTMAAAVHVRGEEDGALAVAASFAGSPLLPAPSLLLPRCIRRSSVRTPVCRRRRRATQKLNL